MGSAARALAPSHPLHVMPSRITRNSLRPRASDRTMVASEATTSLAAYALRRHPGWVFPDGMLVSAHALAGRARAPEHPSLRRPAAWLGSRAGRNRLGILRNAHDNRRSLQVPCAIGHARGTFPRRI